MLLYSMWDGGGDGWLALKSTSWVSMPRFSVCEPLSRALKMQTPGNHIRHLLWHLPSLATLCTVFSIFMPTRVLYNSYPITSWVAQGRINQVSSTTTDCPDLKHSPLLPTLLRVNAFGENPNWLGWGLETAPSFLSWGAEPAECPFDFTVIRPTQGGASEFFTTRSPFHFRK